MEFFFSSVFEPGKSECKVLTDLNLERDGILIDNQCLLMYLICWDEQVSCCVLYRLAVPFMTSWVPSHSITSCWVFESGVSAHEFCHVRNRSVVAGLLIFILVLNSIPLPQGMTVYLSSHLLKNIFVASKLWQFLISWYKHPRADFVYVHFQLLGKAPKSKIALSCGKTCAVSKKLWNCHNHLLCHFGLL